MLHRDRPVWRSDLSPKENQALYGKCSRLHGHTFRLRVSVTGNVNPDGMIINFHTLKQMLRHTIIDRYDHAVLNDMAEYKGLPVTAENMAMHIFGVLDAYLAEKNVTLVRVRLYETPTSWADMTREGFARA